MNLRFEISDLRLGKCMPDIITCFKWVVDEAYIRKTSSGALDFSSVDYKIGEYDRNAIEEAVRLREAHGGKVTALSVGTPESSKGIKDALSRGCDEACFVADAGFKDMEPSQTAAILSEVISSKIKFDLIICGEGSSDLYAQQVGPRIADSLGIPCICFVQKLRIEGSAIIADRRAENVAEIVTCEMPALITVLPEINTPRIPGVRDTLMASKKPVITVSRGELGTFPSEKLKVIGLAAAAMERNCVKFGTDDAGINGFVNAVRKGI